MERRIVDRARERLRRAGQAGSGSACAEILRAVRMVAPFECGAVMTTDPDTLLPSGGAVEGFDASACRPFWEAELRDPDVLKFAELARGEPVASLAATLAGDLDRSSRRRTVYASLDLDDELRVAFVSGGACLGVGVFLRSGRGKLFSPAELAGVRRLVPQAVELLRREVAQPVGTDPGGSPSVLLLDGGDEPIGGTPGADELLGDLRTDAIDHGQLPGSVRAAIARLRSEGAGPDVTTRVRGRSGQWYRLHLAPIEGTQGIRALSVEPARPAELVPILLQSYGLTLRETDVVSCLFRGLSAKEIAVELTISPHTVRDHIKVIYDKIGVGGRGELLARLFAGHLFARAHAAIRHVA